MALRDEIDKIIDGEQPTAAVLNRPAESLADATDLVLNDIELALQQINKV